MNKFYGNIDDNKPENLLRATPYTKETIYNFGRSLTKEYFYDHLFTSRSKKREDESENEVFDRKIDYALRDMKNPNAKVIMLHISGYAGCGKTTYVHHLLWENSDTIKSYDVIDYEGHKKASGPFIDRLAHSISKKDPDKLIQFIYSIINRKLLNIRRFVDYLPALRFFFYQLREMDANQKTEPNYCILLEDIERRMEDNTFFDWPNKIDNPKGKRSFLFFALLFEFLLLLFSQFESKKEVPMVLVIDNSDSLDDLSEEMKLLPAMRDFINECNYFFGDNLENEDKYLGSTVRDVCLKTKLIVFFTTRIVTKEHYHIIQPDWEEILGFSSLSLPEHYYSQKDMILKRIDYYLKEEVENQSKTIEELKQIRAIVVSAYHNYNFMRLFNGNSRKCIERICSILNNNSQETINELVKLSNEKSDNTDAIEGFNGFLLSLILNDFKSEGIYELKLGLSKCGKEGKDGKISLSRMILTIIREKSDRCSLYDLFELLVPLGFSPYEICKCIWGLSEEKREYWRRLLIFNMIMPKSLDDLNAQAKLYENRIRNLERYSELVICTAGRAYMEYVLPHFEFMLSRLESGMSTESKAIYKPLFSSNSEDRYNGIYSNGKIKYLFERKIDVVFEATKSCCYNSRQFSEKAMKVFKLNRKAFIKNTVYNYHSVGWDGDVGPKQSYESRLIFRHISYIEKYRTYLLGKHQNDDKEILVDMNSRLVTRIVRYIKLYQDANEAFQTDGQNIAAAELDRLAEIIRTSNYEDLQTRIQLSSY